MDLPHRKGAHPDTHTLRHRAIVWVEGAPCQSREGRVGGGRVTDLAENPKESQSDPLVSQMGKLRPWEGRGLIHHLELA